MSQWVEFGRSRRLDLGELGVVSVSATDELPGKPVRAWRAAVFGSQLPEKFGSIESAQKAAEVRVTHLLQVAQARLTKAPVEKIKQYDPKIRK